MGPPASKAALKPRLLVSGALALISGYSDVVSFLLFEEFAGLQTGNMVFLGGVLINGNPERALYNIAVMASNMSGVMLLCLLQSWRPNSATRLVGPMCASLTAISEVLHGVVGASKWNICPLSASLGASNFLSISGPVGGMTSLATGNLQKTGKGLYLLLAGKRFDKAERDNILVALAVVLSTILGAILGAAALKRTAPFGHRLLLAPVAVLQLIVLSFHDRALAPAHQVQGVDHAPLLNALHEEAKGDEASRVTEIGI